MRISSDCSLCKMDPDDRDQRTQIQSGECQIMSCYVVFTACSCHLILLHRYYKRKSSKLLDMLNCINIQISAIPFNFRKFSLYNPVEVFFMPIITRCRLLYLDEIHLTSPPSLKTEKTAISPPPLKIWRTWSRMYFPGNIYTSPALKWFEDTPSPYPSKDPSLTLDNFT